MHECCIVCYIKGVVGSVSIGTAPVLQYCWRSEVPLTKFGVGTLRLVGTGLGGVLGYLVMLRSGLATRCHSPFLAEMLFLMNMAACETDHD